MGRAVSPSAPEREPHGPEARALENAGVFRLKLALIYAGALNALAFHLGVHRSVLAWDRGRAVPLLARCHAALSIALWTATIACGRLLAYT